MKFDVFNWSEVPIKTDNVAPEGRLWLRLSKPGALYVSAQGYEVLAGYGAEFDLKLAEAVTFRIDSAESVRAFMFVPEAIGFESDGEVFTNADRMITESGSVLEIKRALREFQVQQKRALAQIRAESAALDAKRETAPKTAPEPAPEPTPEPTPEPAATTEVGA